LPRDVVSRAMTARMLEQGVGHLWLDARALEGFSSRFPTIHHDLASAGLDPARDLLPIAPAAHYHCGGVITDLDGATTMPGLWAAGEVTCTGVHGANRLASNSLLEGMVFGPRVIEAIERGVDGAAPTGAMRAVLDGGATPGIGGRRISRADVLTAVTAPSAPTPPTGETVDVAALRNHLQRTMTERAGVLRSADSLAAAATVATATRGALEALPRSIAVEEMRNLADIAEAIVAGATVRAESRGAHTRTDHPATEAALLIRLIQ
jgi:L-aspartate oxidase